jgi:hypothetical protein
MKVFVSIQTATEDVWIVVSNQWTAWELTLRNYFSIGCFCNLRSRLFGSRVVTEDVDLTRRIVEFFYMDGSRQGHPYSLNSNIYRGSNLTWSNPDDCNSLKCGIFNMGGSKCRTNYSQSRAVQIWPFSETPKFVWKTMSKAWFND